MANRGRPLSLVKRKLREALLAKDAGSRFLNLKLVSKGYFTVVPIKNGKRGRPAFSYELTKKANGFIAFSNNWGKIENAFRHVEEVPELPSEPEPETVSYPGMPFAEGFEVAA